MTRPGTPARSAEETARLRANAEELLRGAHAAARHADRLENLLVTEPTDALDVAATAAREIEELAFDRLFEFLDRSGLRGTDADPRDERNHQ